LKEVINENDTPPKDDSTFYDDLMIKIEEEDGDVTYHPLPRGFFDSDDVMIDGTVEDPGVSWITILYGVGLVERATVFRPIVL